MSAPWIFIHLLGAATLVGGVIFMALLRPVADGAMSGARRAGFFQALGQRFAIVSGVALFLLLISGNELVKGLFGSWGNMGDAPRGDILMAKLGVLVLVIVLFAFHGPLGAKMRRLREGGAAPGDGSPEGAGLVRMQRISNILQGLILAGFLVILYLAAELTA